MNEEKYLGKVYGAEYLNYRKALVKFQKWTKLNSIFLTFHMPKSSPSCKNFTSDRDRILYLVQSEAVFSYVVAH